MAHLLVAEFFPKWLLILHVWLTSEPNYEEVGEWFLWWKGQIDEEVNKLPVVEAEWNKGLEMINLALELGGDAKMGLPPPVAGPAKPFLPEVTQSPSTRVWASGLVAQTPSKSSLASLQEPTTFKDVLEEWCLEQDLMLIPLREAHDQTGLPLFRITASASGKGGVVVYIKGDVVWARGRKERDVWGPTGLGEGLVARGGES